MHNRLFIAAAVLSAFVVGGVFSFGIFYLTGSKSTSLPALLEEEVSPIYQAVGEEPPSVVFTGDVMLARDVEMRLLREERGYSLSAIKDVLVADAIVMNFEASIPERHVQTQHMEMRFSVLPDLVNSLVLPSSTYFSLANNHSLDFGVGGYKNTIKVLSELGFRTYGHATAISSSSVSVIEKNRTRIKVLYLNATYGQPDIKDVKNIIESAGDADLTVAYVHWGTEYELINDNNQKILAYQLIDIGFDLIVGHHPHVVQNVERYKNGTIFYSLGNFIFDQYWRSEVQEGLILRIEEVSSGFAVDIIPVESSTVRVQPRPMLGDVRETFLKEIASRSSQELSADIAKGRIVLQF